MIKDYINVAIKNLRHRKVRSWLTILGIIISIMSIVALISISNGLENAIEEQFEKVGSNRIYVMIPGGAPGTTAGLTTDDVEVLERMSEFEYVTPYYLEPSVEITYSKEEFYGTVTGWPTDDADERFADYDFNFVEGRNFKDGEKYSAVIGYLVSTDSFENENKKISVGNSIYINDVKFKVVGVMEEIGNEQDDRNTIIPIDIAWEIFNKTRPGTSKKDISFIDATIKDGIDLDEVVEKTQKNLERARDDENFDILTPTQILNFLGTALFIVQGILVSIAAISLVVGCIGIMNSMYTSVLERTKEIGIMKSLGARNNDIMLLFLIESGLIGLVGGVIGILIGMGVSFGVGAAAAQAGFALLKIEWSWGLVIGSLFFAFFIGMFSGALPSRQAAKMRPVEALRWNQ